MLFLMKKISKFQIRYKSTILLLIFSNVQCFRHHSKSEGHGNSYMLFSRSA